MRVDTGSSDLWVNVRDRDYCREMVEDNCQSLEGIYDRKASTTLVPTNHDMFNNYADGSIAYGRNYIDAVQIAGVTLENTQVGLAEDSKGHGLSGQPICGI